MQPDDRVTLVPPTKHLMSRAFLRAITGVDPRMLARRLASDTNREIRNIHRRRAGLEGGMEVAPYVPPIAPVPMVQKESKDEKDERVWMYPYAQYLYPGQQIPGGYFVMPPVNSQAVQTPVPTYIMPPPQPADDQAMPSTIKQPEAAKAKDAVVQMMIGIHVCKTCGAARSPGYHRDHPLVPGQEIVYTDCGRCKKMKDPDCYTDSDGDGVPKRRNAKIEIKAKDDGGNIHSTDSADANSSKMAGEKKGKEKAKQTKKASSSAMTEIDCESGSTTDVSIAITSKSLPQQKRKPSKSQKEQVGVEEVCKSSSSDQTMSKVKTKYQKPQKNKKVDKQVMNNHSERKLSSKGDATSSCSTDEIIQCRKVSNHGRHKDRKFSKHQDQQNSKRERNERIASLHSPQRNRFDERSPASPDPGNECHHSDLLLIHRPRTLQRRCGKEEEFPIPGVRHVPSDSIRFLHRQQTPSSARYSEDVRPIPPLGPSPPPVSPPQEPKPLRLPKAKRNDSYQEYVKHHERPPRPPYPNTDYEFEQISHSRWPSAGSEHRVQVIEEEEDDNWSTSPPSVGPRGRTWAREPLPVSGQGKRRGSILRLGSGMYINQSDVADSRSRSGAECWETLSKAGTGQERRASSGEKHVMWKDTRQREDWHDHEANADGKHGSKSRSGRSQTRDIADGLVMSGAIPATQDEDNGW